MISSTFPTPMHFGVVCPPGTSHVTGMTSIGRELRRRGHHCTVFNIPDVASLAESEGCEFCAVGADEHPLGSLRKFSEKLSTLKGLPALRFGLATAVEEIEMLLRDAPGAMRASGVTALIVDQGQPAGSTLAERLRVPFVTVCNAVTAVPDPAVPPSLTPWQYTSQWLGRLRNRAAYSGIEFGLGPVLRAINRARKDWGFRALRSFRDSHSTWAEISQQIPEFDFPNKSLPREFHYVGYFNRPGSLQIPFPFERLDGRPLVYATTGTIHSDMGGLLRNLAEACHRLNVQLAITLGGKGDLAAFADLPGAPIVVHNAPQLEVLKRTAVTFCHGGNNTVLESLIAGAPVIAMPYFGDQFGNGARLIRSRTGYVVPPKASPELLQRTLQRVLSDSGYRERAQAIGRSIQNAGGEVRAADIIEEALQVGSCSVRDKQRSA